MNAPLAVDVSNLRFQYEKRWVVDVPGCQLSPGESMAVIGHSGCGKTTFVHLLAGLLRPSSGTVKIFGQDLSKLRGAQLDRFRGQRIGLVFQRFHLLPALTVRENVILAQRLARVPLDESRANRLFGRLALNELERLKPSMLSQGQAQRVAIARALIHGPALIIADEPTSALDDYHAEQALELLQDAASVAAASLLVVTHDQRVRGRLNREFEMVTPQ